MRRLLSIAGLAALSMLAIAAAASCGQTAADASADADAVDGAAALHPVDAGPNDAAPEAASTCPPPSSGCQRPLEPPAVPWRGPTPIQDVCTPSDIARLAQNLASGTASTFLDLVAGIGGDCEGCLVSSKNSINWGPIVIFTDAGDQGTLNYGACYAAVDGLACGSKEQDERYCIESACSECPLNDQGAFDQCASAVLVKGSTSDWCSCYEDDSKMACAHLAADEPCADIVNAASILCAGGAYDGGIFEAGPGDD